MNSPGVQKKHKYSYDIDMSAEYAAPKIIRMIGEKAKVLELGAGPGSISAFLKKNSNCIVHCAEIDESSIRELQGKVDKVFPCNLNSDDWEKLFSGEIYDFILFADVLEHLYDPLTALKRAVCLMQPSTRIIISLPHVHHMGVAGTYFNNDFSYSEKGLLDYTHIRFFGLKNMDKLITDAGLRVDEVEFVIRFPEETEFAEAWARLPAAAKKLMKSRPSGYVYQVVAKLRLATEKSAPGDRAISDTAINIPWLSLVKASSAMKNTKRFVKKVLPVTVKNKIKSVMKNHSLK